MEFWDRSDIVLAICVILLVAFLIFAMKACCDREREQEDSMTFVRGTIVYIQDGEITVTSGTEGETEVYRIHSTRNLYLYDEIHATVEDDSILVFEIGGR